MSISAAISSPAEVITALSNGKHIRQDRWDFGSELFVSNDQLMFSCRGGAPQLATSDMLTWEDLNRSDWSIA